VKKVKRQPKAAEIEIETPNSVNTTRNISSRKRLTVIKRDEIIKHESLRNFVDQKGISSNLNRGSFKLMLNEADDYSENNVQESQDRNQVF
jgi:hypothetical protein